MTLQAPPTWPWKAATPLWLSVLRETVCTAATAHHYTTHHITHTRTRTHNPRDLPSCQLAHCQATPRPPTSANQEAEGWALRCPCFRSLTRSWNVRPAGSASLRRKRRSRAGPLGYLWGRAGVTSANIWPREKRIRTLTLLPPAELFRSRPPETGSTPMERGEPHLKDTYTHKHGHTRSL